MKTIDGGPTMKRYLKRWGLTTGIVLAMLILDKTGVYEWGSPWTGLIFVLVVVGIVFRPPPMNPILVANGKAPVPRCDTCVWWHHDPSLAQGLCRNCGPRQVPQYCAPDGFCNQHQGVSDFTVMGGFRQFDGGDRS